MHNLIRKFVDRLPLQFRALYHQFLLRIVDLEALSIEADIPRFLGQFAGVLMMFSMINALGLLIHPPIDNIAYLVGMFWTVEQRMIFTMMLVVGLFAVISWDSIFPDRCDVMVLGPLPLTAHTILIARMAASGAVVGLAVLALNFAVSCALSLLLGGFSRFLMILAAYLFTMIAASLFLYGSVLTVQGLMALLLPRRVFLRVSALLQIAAYGLFISVYFLEPTITSPSVFVLPANQRMLDWSPPYWFFALFNQLIGSLPPALSWLAQRSWMGLGIAVAGASVSLLLCYLRTMRRIVEEPDLVPGAGGFHGAARFGSRLQNAIMLFSVRSLTRSRQHRVAYAFALALVLAIVLSWLRDELSNTSFRLLTVGFLISTFMMMGLAVFGLRSVFSLPISLTANWVWRITQLAPPEKYIAQTRALLLFFAVTPVWLVSACLALDFRPWSQVVGHLTVLALIGWIFTELSLIDFYKVPFTCSYLPGKSNFQFVFWGFVVLFALAVPCAEVELRALQRSYQYTCMASSLSSVAAGLWTFNRQRARSALLYFEELPEEVLTTLKLIQVRPSTVEDKPVGRLTT
jgi:hypothetical protein